MPNGRMRTGGSSEWEKEASWRVLFVLYENSKGLRGFYSRLIFCLLILLANVNCKVLYLTCAREHCCALGNWPGGRCALGKELLREDLKSKARFPNHDPGLWAMPVTDARNTVSSLFVAELSCLTLS